MDEAAKCLTQSRRNVSHRGHSPHREARQCKRAVQKSYNNTATEFNNNFTHQNCRNGSLFWGKVGIGVSSVESG